MRRCLPGLALVPLLFAASCVESIEAQSRASESDDAALAHGRDVWFDNTYGGQKFFTFLAAHPDPSKRINIGFAAMLATPRAVRFDQWGVINDPDCSADPGGGTDICPNPTATGVVGIRKFPGPGGTTMYGVSCASCHAGLDPLNPPADPNDPSWENIHPTIGNQYGKFGKIFAANLAATDVRRIMFAAWPDGTVDTTALFNDNIMNPGVVTAFWNHEHRPVFDVGMDVPKMRNGQGGEDDVGGDLAAIRVYTNIGVCFAECIAPRADRPNPNAPIDLDQCRADCADFPPQEDLDDMGAFLRSVPSPRYPEAPIDVWSYAKGKKVFKDNCASCHDDSGHQAKRVLTDDEVQTLDAQATNACRALTNKWDAGQLWAAFSSDVYKGRGYKGYRTMPLTGVWTTTPFLHNQSIGEWAPAHASVEERADSYQASMLELLSATRTPQVNVLPFAVGPFPAGTPLAYLFSRDPATGAVLCTDVVENRGHTYGAGLSDARKQQLIYWLKYQ